MRSLLRSAAAAAQIAGERPDLWIPGALASLAFLAWLPFILAVVPLPSAADIAFLGADLYTSARWPLNAVQLVALIAAAVVGASVLISLGEASLLRRLHPRTARRSLSDDAGRLWLIQVVAALPAVAAAAVVLAGIAAVAPGEYQSPDIGGPLGVRIARDIAPFAVALLVAVLAGQAFGAAATRRAMQDPPLGVAGALAAAARDVLQRGGRLAILAVVTLLAYLVSLTIAFLLLRLLWSPIGVQLAPGQLGGPQTLLLLVGFVAIWLCLLIGVGALHAWASAWWMLELEHGRQQPMEPSARGQEIGQA